MASIGKRNWTTGGEARSAWVANCTDQEGKQRLKTIATKKAANAWGQIGPPKSRAGRREIPMAPMVVNVLREWKLACPSSALNRVFPNGVGNVESYANMFHRGIVPLLKAAGIVGQDGKPRFTFHALRHAAAALFIEQGWSPRRDKTVIGHASVAVTMDTYGHLFPDLERDQDATLQIEAQLLE